MTPVEQANEALRAKGYSEAQLAAFETPKATKALLKGSKIVSPFADSPEVVLRVAQELVPPAEELGRRQLTPREFRANL
jgi:hypothetical protein